MTISPIDQGAINERALVRDLDTIARNWGDMLDEVTSLGARVGRSQSGGGGRLDEKAPSEADLTRLERVIALRQEVTQQVHHYARDLIDEYPLTTVAIEGTNTLAMVDLLRRYAGWLVEAYWDVPQMLDEMRDLARRVEAVTDPWRREWIHLGHCPFVIDDRFCTGRVRMRVAADQDEAGCSKCQQVGPLQWWEEVLGIAGERPVTLPQLVPILSERLHVTVTDRTLRNWVRDAKITPLHVPIGPQPQHRRFDPRTVVDEVARMDRECPSCGRLWSGQGPVCSRCFAVMKYSNPRRAKERTDWSVVNTGPRIVKKARRQRIETPPEHCEFSDLPVEWCGCGRHASAS